MSILRPSMVKSTIEYIESRTNITDDKRECIVKALNKQLEKEVDRESSSTRKAYITRCPVCTRFLTANTPNSFNYCPTCGQKLKRSAENVINI